MRCDEARAVRPCAPRHSRATRPPSRKRAERCETTVSIISRDRPCPVCPTPRPPLTLLREAHSACALCWCRFLYVFVCHPGHCDCRRGVYCSRCRWYLGNKPIYYLLERLRVCVCSFARDCEMTVRVCVSVCGVSCVRCVFERDRRESVCYDAPGYHPPSALGLIYIVKPREG